MAVTVGYAQRYHKLSSNYVTVHAHLQTFTVVVNERTCVEHTNMQGHLWPNEWLLWVQYINASVEQVDR